MINRVNAGFALFIFQEAISILRKHAGEWNINPNEIGFLEFSAGLLQKDFKILKGDWT